MGYNVFVSYKYHDSSVKPLGPCRGIVRDYVDELEKIFDRSNNFYYRGEHDGEDLSSYSEEYITKLLADKIFYTTITLVLMSPHMKDDLIPESKQWIPWEIQYSLRENRRESGKSHTNAVLCVALPDSFGSYDYAIVSHNCHRTVMTGKFFKIISSNMYNRKKISKHPCTCGCSVFGSDDSYIQIVKWEDFMKSPNYYLNKSIDILHNKDDYDIVKTIE